MTSWVQLLALFIYYLSFFSSTCLLVDVMMNLPSSFHTSMNKNPVSILLYKKKASMGKPIHKKYKANKSMRTHGMKEHNNQS
jgi:hypothetical protein